MPTPNYTYGQSERCQYCNIILGEGDPVFTCRACSEFNNDPSNFPKPSIGVFCAPVAIGPKKKRVEVHMMPELKEALIKLAKADKRSLLNYIETLLEKHVEGKTKRGG